MKIEVKLFAAMREQLDADQVVVSIPDTATVADLSAALIQQYPSLAAWQPSFRTAVNQEFAHPDNQLRPNDEVAIIPPVSGG